MSNMTPLTALQHPVVRAGLHDPGTRFTHVIFLDITTYDCSRITPSRTSFWTVNFSLILFEWGLVPTNSAFSNRTLFKLLSLFKQNVSSSLDSNLALVHAYGGSKYLSHLGHGVMFACFCKLSVMSTSDFKHVTHIEGIRYHGDTTFATRSRFTNGRNTCCLDHCR